MRRSYLIILFGILILNISIAQPPPPDGSLKYNFVRALNELNINGTANVYPYISPDGMRLYYSQGISSNPFDMKYEKLYFASRSNIKDEFSNPTIVSNLFPDSVRSCWLTNDELEIFYISGNQSSYENSRLFHATRTSMTSPFSNPEQIYLDGMQYTNNWSTLIGPSLTPDKKELYLYNTVYLGGSPHTYSILRFTKDDENVYTLKDTLARDLLKVPTAGQLSKDGLKYLLGYINKNGDSLKLIMLSRDTIKDSFKSSSKQVLLGKINTGSNFNWQPSITADYSTIAFVRELPGGWNSNLLYLAMDTSFKAGINDIVNNAKNHVYVYPNPVSDFINFESEKYINNATISIYNAFGEEVMSFGKVNGFSYRIDRKSLVNGIYFYSIKNKNVVLANGKILLQ